MITTLKNKTLTAQIKHLGAELISLQSSNNKEYIWEGNPEFWGKHSPILFPIVGALKNNSYQYNGLEYHLSRHGFAREMEFKLLNATSNSATFSLQSNDITLQVYPFEFELHVIYTLEEKTLSVGYQVINNGKSKIPFSIGAHPAFALPKQFENYVIAFEKEEVLEYFLLEEDLVSHEAKKLETVDSKQILSYDLFINDALIFKTIQSKSLTLLENNEPLLKVSYPDFPSLGLWTKMNAPFLCIEPWFGYSDTITSTSNLFDKEGIQILEVNGTFHSKFEIEIF